MPSRHYPNRKAKSSSHGRGAIRKSKGSERRSPAPINQQYVISEVNDALDAQFEMYSWEDMLRDSGLNKTEQKWAKDHLHYRVVEIGEPSVPRPIIPYEQYSAAKEYLESLEGEMHSVGMASNNEFGENGLAALMEVMKAAKKAGLVDEDTEYDKALQQAGSVDDGKQLDSKALDSLSKVLLKK